MLSKWVFNDEHENHNPIISQAHLKFPPDYPYNPPSIRFLSKVWHPNVYEVIHILKIPLKKKNLDIVEWRPVCIHPAPPGGRPPVWRAALWKVESHPERPHNTPFSGKNSKRCNTLVLNTWFFSSGEFAKRAEHVKSSQCGCVGDVPEVEGQQRKRQRVREHHQVTPIFANYTDICCSKRYNMLVPFLQPDLSFAFQETGGRVSCWGWQRPSCCTAHYGRVSLQFSIKY